MSEKVTMRHPTLPDDQTITVSRSAVPHMGFSGWVEVDPGQDVAPEPEPQTPASGQAAEPPKTRGRRAQQQEE